VTDLLRSPNVIAYWREGRFVVEEFVRRRRITAAPLVAQVLGLFSRPLSAAAAARQLPAFAPASVKREIGRLAHWGFLVPATGKYARDVAAAWRGSFAAAHFHFVSRDLVYLRDPEAQLRYVRARFEAGSPPSVFRRCVGAERVPLARGRPVGMSLRAALSQRRTTRQFGSRPVALTAFARLVQGTWGRTGWLDGGVFGRLLAKTSPSAGARHPIECYLLVWRVSRLPPGLYHFDVEANGLARLRRGDFRNVAVAVAGGQPWIRNAAFLCVMTAIADRVFWKYASSDAYRLFLLDAGHLGQTFCLLATALGLGAFTTAALSERRIERLLGVDGISEFPVYLCGAGVPAGKNAWRPPASESRQAQVRLSGRDVTVPARRSSSIPRSGRPAGSRVLA
jgi:SagB-type dehydrogenase family enzyme